MRSRLSKYLLHTLALLLVFLSVFIVIQNETVRKWYANEQRERLELKNRLLAETEIDFTVGAEDPRVRLVLYTDTDCPFCKRLEPHIEQLLQTYPEQIAVTYRHTKFPGLYPPSRYEHLALECVGIIRGAQAYKEFQNEYLFENKFDSDADHTDSVVEMATTYLGEDSRANIRKCINDPETAERIQTKVDSGHILGIRFTPSWFVTGETIDDPPVNYHYTYEGLVDGINRALSPETL